MDNADKQETPPHDHDDVQTGALPLEHLLGNETEPEHGSQPAEPVMVDDDDHDAPPMPRDR